MSFHVQHKTVTRSPLSDLLELLRKNDIEPNGIGGVHFDPDPRIHQDVWLQFLEKDDEKASEVLKGAGYEDEREDTFFVKEGGDLGAVLRELEGDRTIMSVLHLREHEGGNEWSVGARLKNWWQIQPPQLPGTVPPHDM